MEGCSCCPRKLATPAPPRSPPPAPQRLAALTADAVAAEAYLAPRHVVDVLRDFRLAAGAALGPAELLGTLRQLQPRLYSISSSQVGAWLLCSGSCSVVGAVLCVTRAGSSREAASC